MGGMPYTWTQQEIHEFWSECGEVLDVACMKFRDTGRFKGIAKITYKSEEGFNAALECDGECWNDFTFAVSKWKHQSGTPKPKSTSTTHHSDAPIGERVAGFDVLFMCNLPLTMTEDEIAALFEEFQIEAVRLKRDVETGRSKGYAQIHFKQDDSRLEQAIVKLDRTVLQGRTVRLGYAVPPPNWKPRRSNTKKEHLRGASLSACDFSTPDGKFLVHLSGMQPTATPPDVRLLFSDVKIDDVVPLWSQRKHSNSGSLFLLVSHQGDLAKVMARDDTFHQGRRLHVRPGKVSEYLQKKSRSGKRKRKALPTGAAPVMEDEDDPLMSLL